MEPSKQPLQYKYEEYEDDFHNEGGDDKNHVPITVDYQGQTTPPRSIK